LGFERPIKRSREFVERCRSRYRRASLYRPEESDKPLAEYGDFRATTAPSGEGLDHLGFECAVQGIDHEPGLSIGYAQELGCAEDRPAFLQGLNEGNIGFVETAAIRQRECYMNSCSSLASVSQEFPSRA
jgi:hypothetical protein